MPELLESWGGTCTCCFFSPELQISPCVFYPVSFLRLFSFPTVVSMGMSRVWVVCVTLPTAAQSVSVLLNFWGFFWCSFCAAGQGQRMSDINWGCQLQEWKSEIVFPSSGSETIQSKSCTNHCFHTSLRMDLYHPQSPGVWCELEPS